MKEHRRLLESYQELSWALAMEQVAIRQGEQARFLEEQLQNDPQAAVPQEIIDHGKNTIRKKFAAAPIKRVKGALAKALIAAVICALTISVACAFSPEFKEFLLRAFYSVAETFTSITFQDPQGENTADSQEPIKMEYCGLRFEWLPKGYEYVDGVVTSNLQWVDFENNQQDTISVRVAGSEDQTAYNYDYEQDTVTSITVGDHQGQIIENEDGMGLIWVDTGRMKSVSIYASHLSQEKFLQLAESLRY